MLNLENKDFTIYKYEKLLKEINDNSITVYRVIDWRNQAPEKGIFIRHDVDRKAKNSLLKKIKNIILLKSKCMIRFNRKNRIPLRLSGVNVPAKVVKNYLEEK